MARVTESEVALAVMRIAADRPNHLCTFNRARNEVPNYLNLSEADLAPSETRAGEPMWHQIIRNIQSHHGAEGNFINDGLLTHVPRQGYRVTQAGLNRLQQLGLI